MLALVFVVALGVPNALVKRTAMHTAPIQKPKPSVLVDKPKPIETKKIETKPGVAVSDKNKIVRPRTIVSEPCVRFPVTVTHGTEEDSFPLTMCDGTIAPGAIERLSILARPESADRPKQSISDLVKVQGDVISPGIRRVDERLPHVVQTLLDHFDKFGVARKVHLISGYRPLSKGSYHATAQALDFRVDGVSNEQMVVFCKSIPDVGCGYYPNSTFVHVDVRPPGTGHVTWIDVSGPGQTPYYVSKWPPGPFDDDPRTSLPDLPHVDLPPQKKNLPLGSAEL